MSLSLALCALTLGGCLDRGGLDPLPDAGGGDDGGGSGGATGSGSGGARSGGAPGTGGASQTGGATGTGGVSASGGTKATGGATATGGRMGSGGVTASGGVGGSGGIKGTGGSMGTGGKKMCGALCDIFCPYGNVLDADGCPTCKCNPMPMCPQIKCMDNCPNGYLNDEKGCQTCMCNPDNTCPAAECGTMPPLDTIVCPAGTTSPVADPGGAAPLVAPYVCARDASGKCVWQSRTCKPVCTTIPCPNLCPNGNEVGADGCPTCTCRPAPSSVCGSYANAMACTADTSCKWLQPGCGEPALAAAGCYAKSSLGCTETSCGAGHTCLKRVINPCTASSATGVTCGACGMVQTICQ